jgi:hypothetical protein
VSTDASDRAPSLWRLYFTRFVFALVWAALLIATASSVGPLAVTLLVLYPLFDVTAAVIDAHAAKATDSVQLHSTADGSFSTARRRVRRRSGGCRGTGLGGPRDMSLFHRDVRQHPGVRECPGR